jgi:hypothetical protein
LRYYRRVPSPEAGSAGRRGALVVAGLAGGKELPRLVDHAIRRGRVRQTTFTLEESGWLSVVISAERALLWVTRSVTPIMSRSGAGSPTSCPCAQRSRARSSGSRSAPAVSRPARSPRSSRSRRTRDPTGCYTPRRAQARHGCSRNRSKDESRWEAATPHRAAGTQLLLLLLLGCLLLRHSSVTSSPLSLGALPDTVYLFAPARGAHSPRRQGDQYPIASRRRYAACSRPRRSKWYRSA